MLIAALFTIVKTLTDKWIKKLWFLYTMKYYTAIKKTIFE